VITFPTDTVFVEGPDLSGKSTMISDIHRKTTYRWHMMDRSKLSRSIFSKLYDRRSTIHVEKDFLDEASNLNNRYVFLMPAWDLIVSRYKIRGDEIHDISSLKLVYDAFNNKFSKINRLSNVIGIPSGASDRVNDFVISEINRFENFSIEEISDHVKNFIEFFPNKESNRLKLTICDDGEFNQVNDKILRCKGESQYYQRIYDSLMKKIDSELLGINEYSRVEDHKSRRFIFTDDTCISLVHVLIRDKVMDIRFVCRSTDIKNKFHHDLDFLYFLTHKCWERFNEHCSSIRMCVNLNSAHILV